MNRNTVVKTTSEVDPEPDNGRSVNDYLVKLGGDLAEINRVKRRYPMKISSYYQGLIREKGDPIWKQCVPSAEELKDFYNIEDPLHEEEYTRVPHLVHKYPDRVLLLVSSKCALYCRFCTRKRRVGRVKQIPMEEIIRAIEYIEEHPEVRDVIISGGDPLMRSDAELETILKRLRDIPHLEIIRIGTRIPVVMPSRITKRFANMLAKYHPLFINTHFNHPWEITEESSRACAILADSGIPLGNQSVLLRGVNDSPDIIRELVRELVRIRVKPYYIYQCDLVQGVEHFRIHTEDGINIMKQLQGFTSGLCIPHFVIDGPGGKIPVYPKYIRDITPERILISNYQDKLFSYPNPRMNDHFLKKTDVDVRKGNRGTQKGKTIGLVYNLKRAPAKHEMHDMYAEFDDPGTINAIKGALESGGYEVVMIEADYELIGKLRENSIDFVFNIAEGRYGESREAQVPAILDMLNIPYSGSGVLTQSITLNKSRTKEILQLYSIPSPRFQVFRNSKQKLREGMKFPMIVKPNFEGSSKGITNSSLVFDEGSLKSQVKFVLSNYSQPSLVEEYCDGREFTVAIIGNKRPRIMPIVEITFDHLPENIHRFDSHEVKWIYDNPDNQNDPLICPANISLKLKSQIQKIALNTFNALGCVDFCRIDLRLDRNGIPNVLDVNALPGLIPDPRDNSRFPRACFTAGLTYSEMILEMLHCGMQRHKFH